MATTLQGTIQSLLQGVSQQIPRERQPGQLGMQLNMLSDPVTGIRRRPRATLVGDTNFAIPSDPAFLFTAYIERGTDGRHLLINCKTGAWQLRSKTPTAVVNSGTSEYFITSIGATSIQTASIAGLTYILNTEKAPVTHIDNTGKVDPTTTGFFVVTTVAFTKTWDVTVQCDSGTYSASYTSPSASDEGAATNAAAPTVIAQLYNGLISAGMSSSNVGYFKNTLFVHGLSNVVVTSASGTSYCLWSNQSRVDATDKLPANLPVAADNCMCSVGSINSDVAWYVYDYSTRTWSEIGEYNCITSITNMPMELAADDQILSRAFEGVLAGDSDSNAAPGFIDNGYITGISAFQGRLVLLSGGRVSMSASGLYQRFYRSTINSLLDSDRIDISSASAQDSVFRSALQFNRDLVLFGDSMQAVIPGGSALTPTNASISLTSEFSCDSRVTPIVTGQTMLYANRRNSSYAGILEFIPSPYTTSQYVTQDATVHIPKYIPGRVRSMHVSSVSNMGFIRFSGDLYSLLVYEYIWGGQDATKQQAAYHKWTFKQRILSMHALAEVIYIFVEGASGYITVLEIDPREGYVADGVYQTPFMDAAITVTVSGGTFSLPTSLRLAGVTLADIALAYNAGTNCGSEVGLASMDASYLCRVVRGVPDGSYSVGLRYTSKMTLTPPILKDSKNNLIGSGHVRLLRMDLAMRLSSKFYVSIEDVTRDVDETLEESTILLDSDELLPGYPLVGTLANITVPCRSNVDTTDVSLYTSGTGEMNLLDVSYILRHNQRRQLI